MQTNVHIDTKNFKSSPDHRIKGAGGGYSQRNLEVKLDVDKAFIVHSQNCPLSFENYLPKRADQVCHIDGT